MSQAQTPISGQVRDPAGHPVAQARVYFTAGPGPFPDIAALTDERGVFSLSAPSHGDYQIECAAEGFATARTTATVSGDREVRLEISLRPEPGRST